MYMHRKFPDAPAGLRYRKTDTWQECQKVCAEVEPCKGFMWHKKNNKYAKLCLLFSTHNGKIKGTAVSGPKECPKDTGKQLRIVLQFITPTCPIVWGDFYIKVQDLKCFFGGFQNHLAVLGPD